MKTELVTIVSFTKIDTLNGLNEVINKLPYRIQTALYNEWLQSPSIDHGQIIIILISGVEIPNKALFSRFDDIVATPKLFLLDDSRALKQLGSIDRYSDIIIWPCSSEEMSYRIEQVINLYSRPKSRNSLDYEVRETFIKLNLVGDSYEFVQTLSFIHKAAKHDLSVLLLGETGTGKELAARAIHAFGLRSKCPFVPVNCGALPEDIFENEVFGHKKGAYTDAKENQLGLVKQAQGGTLFLDEIDSLSLKSQVALLRFLQDHQYRQLGSEKFEMADVRLIAATNANLEQLTKVGQFREDLYYRLNIIKIVMPALRDRLSDLPKLTAHLLLGFKRRFNINNNAKLLVSANSYRWMKEYTWPGNVRELENVLLRTFSESQNHVLTLLPPKYQRDCSDSVKISGVNWDINYNEAKSLILNAFEKRYVKHVLAKCNGNISKAALHAGKERRSLGKLVKKHNLKNN